MVLLQVSYMKTKLIGMKLSLTYKKGYLAITFFGGGMDCQRFRDTEEAFSNCITKTPERFLCIGPLNVADWYKPSGGRRTLFNPPKEVIAEIPNIYDGRSNCLIDICSAPNLGLPRGIMFPPKIDSYSVSSLSGGGKWVIKYGSDCIEIQLRAPKSAKSKTKLKSPNERQPDKEVRTLMAILEDSPPVCATLSLLNF